MDNTPLRKINDIEYAYDTAIEKKATCIHIHINIERVNIIFILPRTTNYIPVVWVRLIAFTKLRHPQKGT